MERREFELILVTINTKMDMILQRLMQIEKRYEIHERVSDFCPHTGR